MPRKPEQFAQLREQSREKILAAAMELFARNGYESTSIDSIAKKAGISKGLVYNYYESKKSILLAIFDDAMSMGESIMDQHKDHRDPYEGVQFMIQSFFKMIRERKEYLKLLIVLSLQPGALEDMKDYGEKMFKKSQAYMRTIFGKVSGNDAGKSIMLDALMDGVMVNYLRHGDKYPMKMLEQRIIEEYCTPPHNYKPVGSSTTKNKATKKATTKKNKTR